MKPCPKCWNGQVGNPAFSLWWEREERRNRIDSSGKRYPENLPRRVEDPRPDELIECPDCEGASWVDDETFEELMRGEE